MDLHIVEAIAGVCPTLGFRWAAGQKGDLPVISAVDGRGSRDKYPCRRDMYGRGRLENWFIPDSQPSRRELWAVTAREHRWRTATTTTAPPHSSCWLKWRPCPLIRESLQIYCSMSRLMVPVYLLANGTINLKSILFIDFRYILLWATFAWLKSNELKTVNFRMFFPFSTH